MDIHLEVKCAARPLESPSSGPVGQPRVGGRARIAHGGPGAGGHWGRGGSGPGTRHVLEADGLSRNTSSWARGPSLGGPLVWAGDPCGRQFLLDDLSCIEQVMQEPVDKLDRGEEDKDEERVDDPCVPLKSCEVLKSSY